MPFALRRRWLFNNEYAIEVVQPGGAMPRYIGPGVLIAALVLVATSLVLFFWFHWFANQLGLPESLTGVGLVFVQGLLAILVIGLTYFAFEYSSKVWLGAGTFAATRSAMVVASGVSMLIAIFSAAVAVTAPKADCTTAAPALKKMVETVVWTQFGIGDSPEIIARALIGETAECPSIDIGNGIHQMRERRDARSAIFGRLCEKRVTWNNKSLKIEISRSGEFLLRQTVKPDPKRMVVMGDTGCRVASHVDQGCSSDATWPFGLIAQSAARAAPDLILHMGDYFYRETSCERSSVDCAPRHFGDRAESWWIDFFEPARALLPKAPWVFVRGNHEDCMCGGYGWFYYFGNSDEACDAVHETTYLPFADVLILHFDTSHADDEYSHEKLNKKWNDLAQDIPRTAVLSGGDPKASVQGARTVANLWEARQLVDAVQATRRRTIIMGGDIHTFQVLDVVPATDLDEAVTQVIVGNGGSSLDKYGPPAMPPVPQSFGFQDYRLRVDPNTEEWQHTSIGKPLLAEAQVWPKFGFALLSLKGAGAIELEVYDRHGNRQFSCDLGGVRKLNPPAVSRSSGASARCL